MGNGRGNGDHRHSGNGSTAQVCVQKERRGGEQVIGKVL